MDAPATTSQTLKPAAASPAPNMARPLHYAPPPRRKPVSLRRATVALSLLAVVLVAIKLLPAAKLRFDLLALQRQCMLHAPSANAATTIAADPVWMQFSNAVGASRPFNGSRIFLGRMARPDAAARLVEVEYLQSDLHSLLFEYTVVQPGDWNSAPRVLQKVSLAATYPSGQAVQSVAEGKLDSVDPSRFRFEIQTDAGRLQYDGWLRNDDTMTIEPNEDAFPREQPSSSPGTAGRGPG
jgi:hypothetical protein